LFDFKGDSEYLEDIASRIVAPSLTILQIRMFNQLIFNTPLLRHFISRTGIVETICRARISFSTDTATVAFYPEEDNSSRHLFELRVSCKASDWQLSSLAQVCSSALPPLHALECLEVGAKEDWHKDVYWHEDMEHTQWLELLHPFTSVKDLVISKDFVQLVAPALQELAKEGVTGVLPALENIFLEELQPPMPVQEAVDQFIAARQRSGRIVNVHYGDGEEVE
jgi:hypothetical protein